MLKTVRKVNKTARYRQKRLLRTDKSRLQEQGKLRKRGKEWGGVPGVVYPSSSVGGYTPTSGTPGTPHPAPLPGTHGGPAAVPARLMQVGQNRFMVHGRMRTVSENKA